MSTPIKLFLSFLLVTTTVYGGVVGYRVWQAINLPPTPVATIAPTKVPLEKFEFTERSGKKIDLSELDGKIFVVNFFWANCNMSCRRLNEKVGEIQKEFKDSDIQFLSITVEPTIDTPERLKKYADDLKAPTDKWWFLNANMDETQDLGTALKVNVAPSSHTNSLIVVDRAGMMRGAFDFADEVKMDSCRKMLRKLLAEQPVGWKPPVDGATPTAVASGSASAAPTPTSKGT